MLLPVRNFFLKQLNFSNQFLCLQFFLRETNYAFYNMNTLFEPRNGVELEKFSTNPRYECSNANMSEILVLLPEQQSACAREIKYSKLGP